MDHSFDTAGLLVFLAGCLIAVAVGEWWAWLWRLYDKREACDHLHHRVTWNGVFLGGHQWSCDDCGRSRPATNDEVAALEDKLEADREV